MSILLIAPLLICCILSLSILSSFGNQIPFVKDYLPMITSVSSSIIIVLCILLAIGVFFTGMSMRRKMIGI